MRPEVVELSVVLNDPATIGSTGMKEGGPLGPFTGWLTTNQWRRGHEKLDRVTRRRGRGLAITQGPGATAYSLSAQLSRACWRRGHENSIVGHGDEVEDSSPPRAGGGDLSSHRLVDASRWRRGHENSIVGRGDEIEGLQPPKGRG